MSNLSSSHDVVSYDPKSTKALSGQRLSKVLFRFTEAQKLRGEIQKEHKCISIPVLGFADIEPMLSALHGAIVGLIEDTQDAIVKEAIESGAIVVNDSDISVSACVAYLSQVGAGSNRLDGDAIKAWYSDNVDTALQLAFAEKLGLSDNPTQEEAEKVQQASNGYRDVFAKLASPKTKFDEVTIEKLEKVLDLIPAFSTDAIALRFKARFNEMRKNAKADLLAL